jgi:protein-disulfide isomerase
MTARFSLLVVRVSALVGLAVSGALYADYTAPTMSFCGSGSGCDTVRRSGYGYLPLPLGEAGHAVPVPFLGLIGFAVLLGVTLLPVSRWRRWLTASAAYLGGAIALGLVWIQARYVGQFCSLCLAVDGSAVLAAAAVASLGRRGWDSVDQAPRLLPPATWAVLAAVAIATPLLWQEARPRPPVPTGIAAFYVPGKINVVEFADFQCPHCRNLHFRLKALLSEYGNRVNFVRLNAPLEYHPHARLAARAAICAGQQGREGPMTDFLFVSNDLRLDSIRRTARELGLDQDGFQSCLEDDATKARVERELSLLHEAGFDGLPTTYVGAERLVGAVPDEVFVDALEKAKRGDAERGVPAPVYFGLAAAVAAGAVALGRFGRRKRAARTVAKSAA